MFSLMEAMASAIELIVDSYVQLGDRQALQVLLDRREKKLAQHLQGVVGYDVGKVLQEIENDIVVISAGLGRVEAPGNRVTI
jgi:hypothetical protein